MTTPAGRPLLVTASSEEAGRVAEAGRDVVLILPPAASGSAVERPPGPARIHVFVGDPEDAAVVEAAGEMAGELGAVAPPGGAAGRAL